MRRVLYSLVLCQNGPVFINVVIKRYCRKKENSINTGNLKYILKEYCYCVSGTGVVAEELSCIIKMLLTVMKNIRSLLQKSLLQLSCMTRMFLTVMNTISLLQKSLFSLTGASVLERMGGRDR